MARHRARRHGGYRRSRTHSFAAGHIEAARRFSAEMGGLDGDVKDYLFSLSGPDLRRILDAYEQAHGPAARAYAEETIPRWRAGRVTMSGMVAERLFGLLPRFMPLQRKYALTEGMWRHFGPSSKKMLRVGSDASLDEVVAQVREHITSVVTSFRIPEAMERRFAWLAQGDVHVKQQLLSHLREQEKQVVIGGARAQVGLLLDRLRADSLGHVARMTHTFHIGKHELRLVFERGGRAVSLQDFQHLPTRQGRSDLLPWIVGSLIALAAIGLMAR